MLAKIGRALTKQRHDDDDSHPSHFYSPAPPQRERHMSVAAAVLSAHPNLSVFHPSTRKSESHDSDDEFHDDDGPPPSPTKRSFKTFFKRSSRLALDLHHPSESSSRMSLPLPKKVRSPVKVDTFEPPENAPKHSPSIIKALPQSGTLPAIDSKQSVRSILRTPHEKKGSTGSSISRFPGQSPSVRFFSRDAYDTSPEIPKAASHSRANSLDSHHSASDHELGIKDLGSEGVNRTDTISLLDMLREEGKVESPSNTLTFAAQTQPGTELDIIQSVDPFSHEKDTPSMIPFEAEAQSRSSLDSSRSSIKSHTSRNQVDASRHDTMQFPTSRSIEIPTGMTNLLDSFPGDQDDSLLPHLSLSEGLYAELHEEMRGAAWMPEVPPIDEITKTDRTDASNTGTIRQRSHTLPFSPRQNEGETMFHSVAQSSPAMSRILPNIGDEVVPFPSPDTLLTTSPVFSRLAPTPGTQELTQFFTPRSAPSNSLSFMSDPRRTESDPPLPPIVSPSARDQQTAPLKELFGTQESLIASLRSQLHVQSSLATHYEAELNASRALVNSLTERLHRTIESFEHYKQDTSKRRDAMARLKRKVRELEGMVEEAEGERSQRSMLDECTAGAMLVLQERCLEAEERFKHEQNKRESIETELESLRDCLDGFNATQNSIFVDRLEPDAEEVEELKKKIEDLEKVDENRKTLETELELLKEENEDLKTRAAAAIDAVPADDKLHVVEVENLRQIIRETSVEIDDLKKHFEMELASKDEELASLKQEVETQWRNTDEGEEKVQSLKTSLAKREAELEEVQGEAKRIVEDYQVLEAKCSEMDNELHLVDNRRAELEEDFAAISEAKQSIESERNSLAEQLRFERKEIGRLSHALEELQSDLHQLNEERRFAVDDAERLKANLRTREAEMSADAKKLVAMSREKDELAAELTRVQRENAKLLDAQQRQKDFVASREDDLKSQREEMARRQAEEDISRQALDSRFKNLEEEVQKSHKKITEMKSMSADKEVEIMQLKKARAQDREDKEGLEIALQAKQQELDLIKRKLQVRGILDGTPSTSKTLSRRDSFAPSAFATPMLPPQRPGSSLANVSSATREARDAITIKHRASFALSSRDTNTDAATETPSTVKKARFTETTMSPPSARRLSVASAINIPSAKNTPSLVGRSSSSRPSLASSASATPLQRKASTQDAQISARRLSASISKTNIRSPPRNDIDDTKENTIPTSVTIRRKVATPA